MKLQPSLSFPPDTAASMTISCGASATVTGRWPRPAAKGLRIGQSPLLQCGRRGGSRWGRRKRLPSPQDCSLRGLAAADIGKHNLLLSGNRIRESQRRISRQMRRLQGPASCG